MVMLVGARLGRGVVRAVSKMGGAGAGAGRQLSMEAVRRLPEEGLVVELGLGEGRAAAAVLTATSCSVIGFDSDPATATAMGSLRGQFGQRFEGVVGRASTVAGALRARGLRPRAV